jgi:hypothetical protein
MKLLFHTAPYEGMISPAQTCLRGPAKAGLGEGACVAMSQQSGQKPTLLAQGFAECKYALIVES